MALPAGQQFTTDGVSVALSADGTKLVYVANQRLFLRSLSESDARPIQGSDISPVITLNGVSSPVFSPDGEAIAYWDQGAIKRIAIGSLRNKLLFILPAALLLSQFVPWLLTPILMLGATYLCYEGAEKVWGRIRGHDAHAAPVAARGEDAEKHMVTGAIRTDFILSAEIMVIALNEVADQAFVPRLIILVVVALVITAA